ncbi:MAG: restriction endonuclease, partial [Anaerolineales bacterium]
MRRQGKNSQTFDVRKAIAAFPAILILAILTTPTGQRLLVAILALVLVAAILLIALKIYLSGKRRDLTRALQISDVDSMAGHHFEHYIAALLESQGFQAKVTRGSGDSGVDIVAKKSDVVYAIQCKRSASNVSRRAVSDAVAGIAHYGCTKAMVV